MVTISLCMIAKNEEAVLARCLDSVKDIVDEIILVDTGSEDATKEIALRYTDKVYDYTWTDDFAAARNESFAHATMDYCMWLDADDVLEHNDQIALRYLKQEMSLDIDTVMMRYNVAFDASGNPTFSYYRERLLKRSNHPTWVGAVHEVVPPAGKTVYLEIAVSHKKEKVSDPDRNLRIFEKLIAQGEELDARQKVYYARELYYHARYQEAIRVLEDYLKENQGWLENRLDACRQLALCNYELKRDDEALRALLHSLELAPPKAELCCDLGKHFYDRQQWDQAVFWYELALTRPREDKKGGFVRPECYGFLPCIQLSVCYDRLGNYHRAAEYNERAGMYQPTSSAYLHNRAYFEKKLCS